MQELPVADAHQGGDAMTPTTPGPWHARPRNINNDLTQDAIAGRGITAEGRTGLELVMA